MVFEILVPEPLEKEIEKKLDKVMIVRLHQRLRKLEIAPDIYGKPLRYPLAGTWEIRFENRWRVLYRIDYEKNYVFLTGFKHKDEM